MKRYYVVLLLGLLFLSSCVLFKRESFVLDKVLKSRPRQGEYVFDYAKILEDVSEYAERYLEVIRKRYGIEALIVSLPTLEEGTIGDIAVKIFNNWKIGKDYNGRGILLLLDNNKKEVKLEVSYELEDVFTDMFCGYIESKQLKAYFLNGNVGIGLLAVMEEIENRAQIKSLNNYTRDDIKERDDRLFSEGAGATRHLKKFQKEKVELVNFQYPAGKTPSQAWQTLIESWRNKVRSPQLGVYTEITKLVYRDYTNLPDSRYEEDVRIYASKPYEVIKNQRYAVIFFGNKKGWENAPFLFCLTSEGWKFDVVHQRKYIRMCSAPYWAVERANHPYIDLLSKCPYLMGQDIPLEYEDIYRIEDDKVIADKIVALEQKYKENSNDFDIILQLGRLYTITSMGPTRHISLLKRAKEIEPQNPLPYKYLAIAYVDSNYQYKKAIKEMLEYTQMLPEDIFGHNFLGYLFLCVGNYKEAIKEFKTVLKMDSNNCYGCCKLARSYGNLYLSSSKYDLRRNSYRELTIEMLKKAKEVCTDFDGMRRLSWLENWVREKLHLYYESNSEN